MKHISQRIRLLPTLRKSRCELKPRISRYQPIKQQRVNPLRLRIRPNSRIKIRRTAFNQKHHGPRISLPRVASHKHQHRRKGKNPKHK